MALPESALAQARANRELRLAVFDVAARRRTDQWEIEATVDLGAVIERIADWEAGAIGDGHLLVPLHDAEDGAITDQAVIVDAQKRPPEIEFYDFSSGGRVRHSIDELARTVIAHRLRYWHPAATAPDSADDSTESPAPPTPPSTLAGRDGDAAAWIDRVRSALVAERERRRHERRQDAPVPDEDAEPSTGREGFSCTGHRTDEYGQERIVLEPTTPGGDQQSTDTFDAGDDVLVMCAEHAGFPVEAAILERDPDRIELAVYWESAAGEGVETAFEPHRDQRFTLVQLLASGPYATIERALRSLERRDRARSRFAGTAALAFSDVSRAEPPATLNREQTNAYLLGLAAEDIALLQTPPWTGTLRLVANLIVAHTGRDRNVGVFAPDLDDLEAIWSDLTDRVTAAAPEAGIDLTLPADHAPGTKPWHADVVGVGLNGSTVDLDLALDTGIVIKAGQVDVARGAIPFAMADRLVLCGDPAQLAPATTLHQESGDLPSSLYEHLGDSYGDTAIVRLRRQYQMNQAIAMYPNRAYYGGALLHGSHNRTWTVDTMAPLAPLSVGGQPAETPTGSWYQEAEIAAVSGEVSGLVDQGVDPATIGVIAPESAQIGKARARVAEQTGVDAEALDIGSPAQFACTAKDAVVLSLVVGDRSGHRWDGRALNVALTRAKRRLTIVANWEGLPDPAGEGQSRPVVGLRSFLDERGLLEGSDQRL